MQNYVIRLTVAHKGVKPVTPTAVGGIAGPPPYAGGFVYRAITEFICYFLLFLLLLRGVYECLVFPSAIWTHHTTLHIVYWVQIPPHTHKIHLGLRTTFFSNIFFRNFIVVEHYISTYLWLYYPYTIYNRLHCVCTSQNTHIHTDIHVILRATFCRTSIYLIFIILLHYIYTLLIIYLYRLYLHCLLRAIQSLFSLFYVCGYINL